MKVFFVSGVDTDVGKTFVTHHLVEKLQSRSIKAIAIKPIETGIAFNASDRLIHLKSAQKILPNLRLEDINLYSFEPPCAPYVADLQGTICLDNLYKQIESFRGKVDVLIIEGAGGLFVPIYKDFFMVSLAMELQERFESMSLIVCDDKLGMINRFLSAKFILDSLKLRFIFFINIRDQQNFEKINLPFMRHFDFETQFDSLIEKML